MTDTSRPATANDLKRPVRALNAFAPGAQTYEMLQRYEQVVDLDGVAVRTVSLEGLLLTKQMPRPQDIQDAIVLRRAIDAGG